MKPVYFAQFNDSDGWIHILELNNSDMAIQQTKASYMGAKCVSNGKKNAATRDTKGVLVDRLVICNIEFKALTWEPL